MSICLVRELLSEVAIVEVLARQGRGEEREDRGWQEGCRNCEQESKCCIARCEKRATDEKYHLRCADCGIEGIRRFGRFGGGQRGGRRCAIEGFIEYAVANTCSKYRCTTRNPQRIQTEKMKPVLPKINQGPSLRSSRRRERGRGRRNRLEKRSVCNLTIMIRIGTERVMFD